MSDADSKLGTITSISQLFKDWYPLPGTVLKQYVIDTRREMDWDDRTAPHFNIDPHVRAGCELHCDPECEHCKVLTRSCPNDGDTSLIELREAECDVCSEWYERARATREAIAWFAEKAKRPPICSDRTKLSNEIAPEWPSMREPHPLLSMCPKERP